jgi:hypothetical protein
VGGRLREQVRQQELDEQQRAEPREFGWDRDQAGDQHHGEGDRPPDRCGRDGGVDEGRAEPDAGLGRDVLDAGGGETPCG